MQSFQFSDSEQKVGSNNSAPYYMYMQMQQSTTLQLYKYITSIWILCRSSNSTYFLIATQYVENHFEPQGSINK